MSKLQKVTIDIYDADGEKCESITSPMDYEDVREQMLEIIKNDGIPVARIKAEEPRRVKCTRTDEISNKEFAERAAAIGLPKRRLIVHAAFEVGGIVHQITGPAGWVKCQISEAVRYAASRN